MCSLKILFIWNLRFSETLQKGRFTQAPGYNEPQYFLLKKWNIVKGNLMNKRNDINLTTARVSSLSGLYSVIMARVTLIADPSGRAV
jgi:hypothetical protein